MGKKYSFPQLFLFAIVFAGLSGFLLMQTDAAPGKGKPGSGSSSMSMVMVEDKNGDGLPNHGDTITFDVVSTVERKWVELQCTQNGVVVYGASAGYFPDYPWPWAKNMNLASTAWASGAADCKAQLYTVTKGTRRSTLATLSFHVNQ